MLNSYCEFKEFIKNNEKKKLLVHACCGPCSTHCLELLKQYFDITVYYANDNMDTLDEYLLRYNELNKVTDHFNVSLTKKEYEANNYDSAVLGLEHLGEHSIRCESCIELRMRQTAKYALEHNFDYFTTTLSISPYKSSMMINEIGYKLENELGVSYLFSDFKKENGYQESIRLSKELDLYRQDYCGCKWSKLEKEEHENA